MATYKIPKEAVEAAWESIDNNFDGRDCMDIVIITIIEHMVNNGLMKFTEKAKKEFNENDYPKNILEEAIISFGLKAQGHLPTIEKMLKENKSWEEIGKEIGWCPKTAKKFYEIESKQTLLTST